MATTVHERSINSFIPQAVQFADKETAKLPAKSETRQGFIAAYSHCFWTAFFHKEMNRLTKEAELRT